MQIEYVSTQAFDKLLDVEDIGAAGVKCVGGDGGEFYYVTSSYMGQTAILKFGPVYPDAGTIGNDFGYQLSLKSVKYSQRTLGKDLSAFLNNPYNNVVEAEDVGQEYALSMLPDNREIKAWLSREESEDGD